MSDVIDIDNQAINKEYLYEQFKLFNSNVLRSIYGMKSNDIDSIDTSNIDVGQVIQYTGETNANYINSFFYRWDGSKWALINMGSSSMTFKAPLYSDGSAASLNLDYNDPNALTGELIPIDSTREVSLTDAIDRIDEKTGSDIKFSDTNSNSIEQVVSSIDDKTGSDINVSDTENTSIASAIEQLREPKVFFSLTDLGLTADATVNDVRNALSGGEIFLAPVNLFNDYQSKFPYDDINDEFASLLIIKYRDLSMDYIRWTNKLGTKEAIGMLNSNSDLVRWTVNRIANDGYTNDGSIVLSNQSTDITGNGSTPESLGLDSDVMKWPNGTYRLSHLPDLITNTPTTITGPATQGRLEHYNLKCWGGNHNPWSSKYALRLSVWYDMDGRIYTRYQESGSKSGNQILADNETNGTNDEPLVKDTGWRAIQTTYTDLGQMGLSTGCTVVDICNRLLKLCSSSNNLTVPGSAVLFNYMNNISGLPSTYGILEVHYYHVDGIVIRYSNVSNSAVYIGKFTANISSESQYEILSVTFDEVLTANKDQYINSTKTFNGTSPNICICNTTTTWADASTKAPIIIDSVNSFTPIVSTSLNDGKATLATHNNQFCIYHRNASLLESNKNEATSAVVVDFASCKLTYNNICGSTSVYGNLVCGANICSTSAISGSCIKLNNTTTSWCTGDDCPVIYLTSSNAFTPFASFPLTDGRAVIASYCNELYFYHMSKNNATNGTDSAVKIDYANKKLSYNTLCGTNVCGTTSVCGALIRGTNVCGTTSVCGACICGTTSMCSPSITGTNIYGTCVCGTTKVYGALVCGTNVCGTTSVRTACLCSSGYAYADYDYEPASTTRLINTEFINRGTYLGGGDTSGTDTDYHRYRTVINASTVANHGGKYFKLYIYPGSYHRFTLKFNNNTNSAHWGGVTIIEVSAYMRQSGGLKDANINVIVGEIPTFTTDGNYLRIAFKNNVYGSHHIEWAPDARNNSYLNDYQLIATDSSWNDL